MQSLQPAASSYPPAGRNAGLPTPACDLRVCSEGEAGPLQFLWHVCALLPLWSTTDGCRSPHRLPCVAVPCPPPACRGLALVHEGRVLCFTSSLYASPHVPRDPGKCEKELFLRGCCPRGQQGLAQKKSSRAEEHLQNCRGALMTPAQNGAGTTKTRGGT